MRRGFIEKSIENLLGVAERSVFAEEMARRPGLLQGLDARVKLGGILALVLAVTLSRNLGVIAALFAFAILLAVVSGIHAAGLVVRVWIAAFVFTAAIALPAIVLTPGDAVARLPLGMTVTVQGLRSVAYLLGRVETAATLSLLLVVSTRWAELLRALRSLAVPLVLVVILGMTYRAIFVLLQSACDLFEGRRSRRVGALSGAASRRMATATAGALLTRTMRLGEDVYLAMQSRGFRGEVHVMDPPRMRGADWLALAVLVGIAAAATVVGR